MLWARESIDEVLARSDTPDELRHKLAVVGRARELARELGLDVGTQYTSYVPWSGDRIVTTVVATRPGEIDAAGFRFPIVGRLPYKGFFDRDAAEREADSLRGAGLDVCIVPVSAYSTLGWLADPVTGPMLRSVDSDADLVELVVHELVHATVYTASAAEFNEGVASFIGEEAAVRYAARISEEHRERTHARVNDDRMLARSMLGLRDEIAELYAQAPADADRELQRAALEAAARVRLAALPLGRADVAALAARLRLGDACLALRGTYAADTARHEALLEQLGGDLLGYVARLREIAGADDPAKVFFAEPDERSEAAHGLPVE